MKRIGQNQFYRIDFSACQNTNFEGIRVGVRFSLLLPPGGSCRVFGSLGCTNDLLECWANRENETEEECGRKCSSITNIRTFSCAYHRNRFQLCTEIWCISRIPHPSFARRQTKILQRTTSPLSAFKCHLSRRSKVRLRRQITAIYAEAPQGKVYALSYNLLFLTH